jgi:polyhydroxyalkanoate synthase subunit PhaC
MLAVGLPLDFQEGAPMTTTKTIETLVDPRPLPGLPDAIAHSAMAKLGRGIAPTSVLAAYLDWIVHLSLSPSKQGEIFENALHEWNGLLSFVHRSSLGECAPCALPHPQDKRFTHELWRTPPYNWISQGFLVQERWWESMMTDVRGVSAHHEDLAKFMTRQSLDVLSPSNYLATNPEVLALTIASGGGNLINGASNLLQDFSDYISHAKPQSLETYTPGKTVALTAGKVVYKNRLIELIEYQATTPTTFPEPLLIVPSWIMKYYILDLSQHNSFVKYLVDQGHTVFMISWKNPDSTDRDLSLENYLDLGVMSALERIRSARPGRKIHGIGYCLGGTLLSMAAATLGRDPRNPLASVSLLASLVDFHEPGEIGVFIDESQITYLEDIMWEPGYLDGKQMASAFNLMNSNELIWSRLVRHYLKGTAGAVNDLQAWNADATRLPYRMHSEYLRSFYLKNDLSEGRFEVHGTPVTLQDLRIPMFVVGTEKDHVSPWKSVYKIHLLTDCEITFVLASGGHNAGIVNSPTVEKASAKNTAHIGHFRWGKRLKSGSYLDPEAWLGKYQQHQGSWWPSFQHWLKAHSGAQVKAAPLGGLGRGRLQPVEDAPGQYVHQT